MSKFKKVTSLAVAGVMAVGMLMPSAFAAKLPEDVEGTKYEESVALLQALEVMVGDEESGAFRLEENIKRSEVAKIAVTIAGLEDVAEASKEKTPFPDVVENHWANGYINVASAQKFVIGDDWGNFRPDDEISFAEAATILTRVLGYEPSALANGGFPTGHLVVAGQIGLLKGGISTGADVKATRGTVAMMAYNGLTIDMMERTGYGSNGEQYEIVDKTLLEDKLEVTKNFGQMVANSESTLTGSSSLRKDEVQIDVDGSVETYKINGTDAKDFLARNIVFYARESETNDDKYLILVRDDNTKNAEVKIPATYVDEVTGSDGSERTLTYWINKETDRKPQKVTIAADAKVFYNGVANADYDIADLVDLKSGHVTLLDTERSDKYNYIFVTEYKNLVVEEVSLASHKVNDKYNQLSLTLDPEDKNIQFTLTKNGEEIGLESLKEWDVLSVAMDKETTADSKIFNVKVSDASVTGKITEIQGDKYKINGEQYEVAENYTTASQPDLALNDEGTFYLDVEGKIAAVDTETKAASNYAYLVDADTTGGINTRLEFELFTKDGESMIVKGANKIKVNGKSGLTAEEAKKAIEDSSGNVAQLITFETNANGEIYYLNTATNNTTNGSPLKNKFSLDFKSGAEGVEYSAKAKKLGRYNVDSNTIVLDIPNGKTDSDDFAVRNISMFVDKSKYEVEIYDVGEDLTAKVVIVKNSKGEVNVEAPIAVVDKIAETQNEDEMTVHKLYAVQNGERVEILAKDNATLVKGADSDLLETGDIIQYQTNARGEIDKVTVLFDSQDRADESKEGQTVYDGTEMVTILGKVTKKFANSINVKAGTLPEVNYNIANAKVYSYDFTKSANSQVSIVDASHITKYDDADAHKVFLRIYKGEVQEVVIIREK